MAKTSLVRTVIALSFICFLGFVTDAVAEVKDGKNIGTCPVSKDKICQGFKQLKGLSDQEMAQVKSEMDAFHKAVEPIKQNLFEKKMAMISELAKQDSDVDEAKKLQTKIYALKNQLGQKKIDYLIRVKKISTEAGRFLLKKFFMKNKGMSDCKGGSSCPGKRFKSKGNCPGMKGLEKDKSI